jgi:hypothetical protein
MCCIHRLVEALLARLNVRHMDGAAHSHHQRSTAGYTQHTLNTSTNSLEDDLFCPNAAQHTPLRRRVCLLCPALSHPQQHIAAPAAASVEGTTTR